MTMKKYFHTSIKIVLLLSLLLSVCHPVVLLAADPESLTATSTIPRQDATNLVSQSGETVTLVFAIIKVIGSLGLVLGIMILLAFFFKKFGVAGGNLKQGSLIKIMDTRMIAPKKYVSVLQIANEYVVVGITDQSINLLSKLDNSEEIENFTLTPGANTSTKLGNSFSALLQKAAKTLTKPEEKEKA
jgi:flagellar biosynthetic protein FliO